MSTFALGTRKLKLMASKGYAMQELEEGAGTSPTTLVLAEARNPICLENNLHRTFSDGFYLLSFAKKCSRDSCFLFLFCSIFPTLSQPNHGPWLKLGGRHPAPNGTGRILERNHNQPALMTTRNILNNHGGNSKTFFHFIGTTPHTT